MYSKSLRKSFDFKHLTMKFVLSTNLEKKLTVGNLDHIALYFRLQDICDYYEKQVVTWRKSPISGILAQKLKNNKIFSE